MGVGKEHIHTHKTKNLKLTSIWREENTGISLSQNNGSLGSSGEMISTAFHFCAWVNSLGN